MINKQPNRLHSLPSLPHYNAAALSQLQSIRDSVGEEERKSLRDQSIHSISSFLQQIHQNIKPEQKKAEVVTWSKKALECTMEEAERIWRNPQRKKEERATACKFIAESMMRSAFGKEGSREVQMPKLPRNKNSLNTKILTQILNEIQVNSRSHSIVIRKSQLEELQQEHVNVPNKDSRFKKKTVKFNAKDVRSEEGKMELLYRLKNQYTCLKDLIISSRSEELDQWLVQCESRARTRCKLKKTVMLPTLKRVATQEKQLEESVGTSKSIQINGGKEKSKLKIKRPLKNRVEYSGDKLVLQNIESMSARLFLAMMFRTRFQEVKVIRLRNVVFEQQLLLFLLDCIRSMCNKSGLDLFEFCHYKHNNLCRVNEKITQILQQLPIRQLKLQALDLTNKQISKICFALQNNLNCQYVSFRYNKIDILGLRYIQSLNRNNLCIKTIDLRNNDIPHYANLKDKAKIIHFF